MSDWEALADISRLPAAPSAPEKTDMNRAVQEFEAYFLGEMLRVSSRTSSTNGLLDGGDAGRMYREMFLEEIGRLASKRGGLGLAESLGIPRAEVSENGDTAREPALRRNSPSGDREMMK